MTNRAIAHARLANSRLVGEPLARPEDVVRWFGAVQAQDVPGALWTIAQRTSPGATMAGVAAAFDDGRFIRTHALRPTWHFLAPDELRWIEALTGPRVRRANDLVGLRRLGIDRPTFERANAVIRDALTGREPAVRDELRAALVDAGIPFNDPNTLSHVLMNAELDGLICSGPRRGKQFTYALVDDRIAAAAPLDPEVALRELTVRYFASHGPALVHDMAWWSGLTVTDVRRGVALGADDLEHRTIDGRQYVAGRGGFQVPDIPPRHVLLLSNYDEYLGSYTDYSPVFDAALPKARTIADPLGAHIVVRDGLVVGGWRRSIGARSATVTVTLLIGLAHEEMHALEAEAEAYGRFLGLPVELRITG
jgi:hypothetical protein